MRIGRDSGLREPLSEIARFDLPRPDPTGIKAAPRAAPRRRRLREAGPGALGSAGAGEDVRSTATLSTGVCHDVLRLTGQLCLEAVTFLQIQGVAEGILVEMLAVLVPPNGDGASWDRRAPGHRPSSRRSFGLCSANERVNQSNTDSRGGGTLRTEPWLESRPLGRPMPASAEKTCSPYTSTCAGQEANKRFPPSPVKNVTSDILDESLPNHRFQVSDGALSASAIKALLSRESLPCYPAAGVLRGWR